jgi:hypothetical protein
MVRFKKNKRFGLYLKRKSISLYRLCARLQRAHRCMRAPMDNALPGAPFYERARSCACALKCLRAIEIDDLYVARIVDFPCTDQGSLMLASRNTKVPLYR